MKKVIIGILIGLTAVIAATGFTGLVLIHRWTNTEYGKLDPKAAIFMKIFAAAVPGHDEVPLEEYRKSMNALPPVTPPEVARVQDESIPGAAGQIPIRIYTPAENEKLPVIILFHGGGFVVQNIETHDNLARLLANKASAIVVSVGYRLAPEHPFPAAVEDAYSALEWVSRNAASFGGDPDRIALLGDSAGGNLAAAVSLMSRDRRGPEIKHQVLIYPVVNLTNTITESCRNFSEGYFLSFEQMRWFRDQYLPEEKDRENPYASPLLAEDHVRLPPALIITAHFDPLRDEGEAYAEKLKTAGVPVKLVRFDRQIHGFLTLDVILEVMSGRPSEALDLVAAELKSAFSS